MKTTIMKWATKAAGAGAIALLLATPAVAQSRGDWNRNDDQRGSYDSRNNDNSRETYRDNQRINGTGRISSFSKERDGYRVRLDNDSRSYWVPQSAFGNRARDLRVGVSIGLGGVFRGGSIYVDAVSWPGDGYGYRDGYGYDGGYLRGVVERVDYRDNALRIRDNRSGRIVTVDVNGRYGRDELRGLRRGDFVELSGQWLRGGVFGADRIDRR
jgi:hypothetical protein